MTNEEALKQMQAVNLTSRTIFVTAAEQGHKQFNEALADMYNCDNMERIKDLLEKKDAYGFVMGSMLKSCIAQTLGMVSRCEPTLGDAVEVIEEHLKEGIQIAIDKVHEEIVHYNEHGFFKGEDHPDPYPPAPKEK